MIFLAKIFSCNYASAVLVIVILSVCLSVCQSVTVTRVFCDKMKDLTIF